MTKDNLYQNGELHKRQHEIIPKGKRPYWCEAARCWLLLDKSLTKAQIKDKTASFGKRYEEDMSRIMFKF